MAKDPNALEDPLKYRVLTVLHVVYRKWASPRLNNLDHWTNAWEEEELFTVKGGAQAAWWTTALRVEHLHSRNVSITGGSADLETGVRWNSTQTHLQPFEARRSSSAST